MVHRTDIAGSSGQTSPGDGGLCPPRNERRPYRKSISRFADKTCGCRSMAVPPARALHSELLTL